MIDVQDVITQLKAYGYNSTDDDTLSIRLAIEKAEEYIKNFCHLKEIPVELYNIAVEIAAGNILKTKLSIGENVNDLIDMEACNIASITEGDVSVSYNSGSDNNNVSWYTAFIDSLISRDNDLMHFRKLRW